MAAARAELGRLESGLVVEKELVAALGAGRSKYEGSGKWSHSGIETKGLEASREKALKFPLVSKSGLRLIAQAAVAIKVRTLLKANDFGALVTYLDGLTKPEEAATEEVDGAWNEVKDECKTREKALSNALSTGRAVKIGAGKWSRKGTDDLGGGEGEGWDGDFPSRDR